jgi:hypothetical protein
MEPKFNLNRPKVSDEEINKHKDFDKLVKQFKDQSIQRAKSDSNFLKNKKATYATVIAGLAVVCTVTYFTVFNKQNKQTATNDKTNTLTNENNTSTSSVTTSKNKNFISPPFKKLDVPYGSYKVNAQKGGELAHHTNTKIKVPKNAFVNKEGKEIIGDVEIKYREFHDQADIIASGIPMTYDSAGTQYTFESAGMFDVRGYQNGEEVFLKQGKPITVDLASRYPDDSYNQYYLDTVAHNWQVIKHDEPQIAPEAIPPAEKNSKEKTAKEIQLVKKIEHVPLQIDSVKTVYDKKIVALPQPKQPSKPAKATGRPQFNLEVDYKDYPELAAFKNSVFEVGTENKNYTKELHAITWSSAVITPGPQKGKNYILNLKYRNREEKLIVYPVLVGEDYEKAAQVFDKKLSEYNAALEKRETDEQKLKEEMAAKQKAYTEEQKKLSADLLREQLRIRKEMETQQADWSKNAAVEASVIRVFSVNNFGIYNSDCARSMPHGPVIEPHYSSNSIPLDPSAVYLVDAGKNIVYNMSAVPYRFMYSERSRYSLCIVAGGNFYVCTKDQFSEAVKNPKVKFELKQLSADAEMSDFKNALEI